MLYVLTELNIWKVCFHNLRVMELHEKLLLQILRLSLRKIFLKRSKEAGYGGLHPSITSENTFLSLYPMMKLCEIPETTVTAVKYLWTFHIWWPLSWSLLSLGASRALVESASLTPSFLAGSKGLWLLISEEFGKASLSQPCCNRKLFPSPPPPIRKHQKYLKVSDWINS